MRYFISIALVVIVGIIGYSIFQNKGQRLSVTDTDQNQNANIDNPDTSSYQDINIPAVAPTEIKQTDNTAVSGSELKRYRNSKYGFEVAYPKNLIVEEGKIEPNTQFVVWKNPNYKNERVNIIYINDGQSALLDAELLKGIQTKIGSRNGYKFISNNNPLYWAEMDSYALAIYFERPQSAGSNYNEYIDISSFKF